MKLFTALVLAIALVMLYGGTSRAQQPTFAMIGNPCSSSPQFGGAQWCFDAVNAATHNVYYWNGTGWTQSATSFTTLTATSAALSGTADETLSLTQNGHISSLLGAADASDCRHRHRDGGRHRQRYARDGCYQPCDGDFHGSISCGSDLRVFE